MAPLSDAQLAALTRRNIELSAQVRNRVVQYIESAWGSLSSWRDSDINAFIARVVPIVEGGQVRMASITDAYLAQLETAALGTPARPIGIAAAQVTGLRGVPTAEVYRRAGVAVWMALSKDEPVQVAVDRGLRRAVGLAETDLQMARTHAVRRILSGKGNVVGYRRVLTGSKSCALCAIASTQRYGKKQLMPIHPGCSCSVAPIYGNRDPGQVIDAGRLGDIQARVEARFGETDRTGRNVADFRDLVVTHEHGEIGPVLSRKGDRHTGPDDI